MVFQNPDNQIVSTIVEEDCAFGLENMGVAPQEIRRRVDEALARVGMAEYALSSPHMLSGGQKQRVAIAGVVAMRPKIIVFDESTAMLDPVGPAGRIFPGPKIEPGRGHHHRVDHPLYGRSRAGGPGGRNGRGPAGDAGRAQRSVFP